MVKWQRAKRRAGTHSTKRRGEVRGGGKKPYKQKGTGNARQGSTRAPHYVGGGTVFGPKPRDYEYHAAEEGEEGRAALGARRCAPRSRRSSSSTSFALDAPKTKQVAAALATLGGRQGADRRREGNEHARAAAREPADGEVARARGPQRLRRARPRDADPDAGDARGRDRALKARRVPKKVPHDAPRTRSSSARSSPRRARACARPAAPPSAPSPRRTSSQKVVFEVARDANKIEIRSAVEALFNVKVVDVHTQIVRGKEKRVGRFAGHAPELEEGDRHAQPGRQDRVLRGSLSHEDRIQADLAGPSRHVRLRLRRDHASKRAGEVAARATRTDGRPQQLRPHHLALPRRRPQAALPRHRLQARQDRRAGQGRVDRVRSEPHGRIALLHYADGEKRYILAPDKLEVGDHGDLGATSADIKPGNALPLRYIPLGTVDPQRRAQDRRAAASSPARPAPRRSSWPRKATGRTLRLPSGEMRLVHLDCRATIGQIGNPEHANIQWGKAGRMRWLGQPPAQPRRHHEPGRPPDGRRRRSHLGRPSPVLAVGRADQGLQDAHNKPTDKFIVRRRGEKG